VLGGALVLPAPLAAQRSDSAPPRVTDSLVAAGRAIYQGRGLCLACHGPDARGGLGPDLTDASWDHGDGSFGAILRVIRDGVGVDSSRSGEVMPARGGGQISDADLRAVAAYVWSLRRPARP
jgi:mono/diheme cytochrome c family protein